MEPELTIADLKMLAIFGWDKMNPYVWQEILKLAMSGIIRLPKAIENAPKNEYVLLRGPSGYTGTPYRYIVGKHDVEFRPLQPWVDPAGDSVLDGGSAPTHFIPLSVLETR